MSISPPPRLNALITPVKTMGLGAFLILILTSPAAAQGLIMKTRVISQDPFTVQEQFMENNMIVADLKIRLAPGGENGSKVPQRVVVESNGTIPDGIYWEYFPAGGGVQFTKSYKNGLKDGPSQELYPDGGVKRAVNYVADKKQGLMKMYYPDGQLQKELNYVDNEHEGVVKNYRSDGKLQNERIFRRGAAEWYQTRDFEYFPDGAKRLETFLDIDTNEGYRKYFFPAGGLQKSLTVKADTFMDYKEYDAAGQLIAQRDGLYNGTLHTYYVDGTLMQEDRYQDGIAAGFTMYDLEGNVLMHSP